MDSLRLSEVEADRLADSLGVTEADVLPTTESLVAVKARANSDSLVDSELLAATEATAAFESDAADSDPLADVDADAPVESDAADSPPAAVDTKLSEAATLAVCDARADVGVESLVDSDPADSLVVVDTAADAGAADSLVDSEGAADSLLESDGAVELLVDSDAADSLVSDVDSVADAEADSLGATPLPGARSVLPSVARVFRFAALMSYEAGVWSDMIYSPCLPRTLRDRIGEITVYSSHPGPDNDTRAR
ncbi:MAG: hypothetical protein FWC87_05755 [Acidimicrobiaceae bacterium]|nr:hypothetical protein [Acidimicrobiaceae bacterium]